MATTVWVLHMSHKHGDDINVFANEQGALDELVAWANEWWGNEVGDVPRPETQGELVRQYFDHVANYESYGIHECEIIN